ncbi:MAG: hypothetical protein IPQ27_04040 [Chitinophagaceae bacterium]|nr:hypothetical protein [Chitinophagaceae bacterium]
MKTIIKKYLSQIIFLATVIFSCTPNNITGNTKSLYVTTNICLTENPWASAFKNGIVCRIFEIKCDKKLYEIMNGDITMGGIHDVLNYDTFYTNKIDEIALEKSKTRYFNFIYEKTPLIMGAALSYRVSGELDSITNFYYRKYQADSIAHEIYLKSLGYKNFPPQFLFPFMHKPILLAQTSATGVITGSNSKGKKFGTFAS